MQCIVIVSFQGSLVQYNTNILELIKTFRFSPILCIARIFISLSVKQFDFFIVNKQGICIILIIY